MCVLIGRCDWSSVKRQCEEKEQRVAVLEETLASAQKEVGDLRSCLREVERSRLEARRELQELRRQVSHAYTHTLVCTHTHIHSQTVNCVCVCAQVKVVDVEREQKAREVAELQTRLSLEEQKEEERAKELFSIKQKLTEAEAARNSFRKEVQRENTSMQERCFISSIKNE